MVTGLKKRRGLRVFAVLTGLALAVLTAALILLAGCGPQDGDYKVHTEKWFVENSRGSFTLMEAAVPVDYEGRTDIGGADGTGGMPLVAVAHGFTGSMDSGGAQELIRRMAAAGIAAVRMDFDGYLDPEGRGDESNRSCEYTLRDMQDDLTLTVQQMCARYDIDTSRLGIYGRSMGGRAAMMAANESYGGFEYQAMALVAPAGNEGAMIYFMGGEENWKAMKEQAASEGFVWYKQLRLRPDWFTQFEEYNPCEHGYKFGEKPVLVICNTLDYVVTDETSRECAAAYKNSRVIEVTTDNAHGYEMSYEDSPLKDQLMEAIVEHFQNSL